MRALRGGKQLASTLRTEDSPPSDFWAGMRHHILASCVRVFNRGPLSEHVGHSCVNTTVRVQVPISEHLSTVIGHRIEFTRERAE
jgi:hypothetical protein